MHDNATSAFEINKSKFCLDGGVREVGGESNIIRRALGMDGSLYVRRKLNPAIGFSKKNLPSGDKRS